MVANPHTILTAGLEAEWQRIDILAQCLLLSRQGKEPTREMLEHLRSLQQQVVQLRDRGTAWGVLASDGLSSLAMDVLACIYASEAYPRIGWLYQELHNGRGEAYASPALLQMLLALHPGEVSLLHHLVVPGGELQQRNLIVVQGEGPLSVLKPAREALAKLLDIPGLDIAPPGSVRVHSQAVWADLVLQPERELMLREFMLWLKCRDTVVKNWGGHNTGGPVALFSGTSGTGKTFAASVIANELGWPLYKVDLGSLVSKYIGETEKNIGRLLDAAHGRKMVLQFDEVDALMSKRGEVKEARDRYANMEVSYLLARIEDHHGPCILTTNLRNQIDKAFSRRFQLVVDFPRPDVAARAELWRRMLPPRAPLHEQVDTAFLASAVNLTGGNIRNIALHAAYLAAAANAPISFEHIATGTWRELAKERQQLKLGDLGALAPWLPTNVYGQGEL